MRLGKQSLRGLMTFLIMLTAFLPFIPFWSMSGGESSLNEKISFMLFHIKKIAIVDFNSFFVMFLNPAIFFLLYTIGLFLSYRYLKSLPIYLSICVLLQSLGCIAVAIIIEDFPLILVLVLPTLYMLYSAIQFLRVKTLSERN